MGLFDFLSPKKELMSYEIVFNSDNNISVKVNVTTPHISNHEYIRMWAFYNSRIIYNLGYPHNETANQLIILLYRIILTRLEPNTNCFERAGLLNKIRYSEELTIPDLRFIGQFGYKNPATRIINMNFPIHIKEQQVIYSSIGLLQYVINVCSNNIEELNLLYKVIFFLLAGYSSDYRTDIRTMIHTLPELAFRQALNTDINTVLENAESASQNSLDNESDSTNNQGPDSNNLRKCFLSIYAEINKYRKMTDAAKNYRIKKYPLNVGEEKNIFLGGCFELGYHLREAEMHFAKDYNFDISLIKHEDKIYNIWDSNVSEEDKIHSLAEYLEEKNNNDVIDGWWDDYFIIGSLDINDFLYELLSDFKKHNSNYVLYDLDEEDCNRSSKSAVTGYLFRIAEEIAESHPIKTYIPEEASEWSKLLILTFLSEKNIERPPDIEYIFGDKQRTNDYWISLLETSDIDKEQLTSITMLAARKSDEKKKVDFL